MAGSVIQATGRTDFEDGPRIGNKSEAGNSLQRVRTIPENRGIIVLRGGVDQIRVVKILENGALDLASKFEGFSRVTLEKSLNF